MEDVITTLYNAGGLTLVAVGCIIIALFYAGRLVIQKWQAMDNKIDKLSETVTDLKVELTTYLTAIKTCSQPNCPNKQLLQK